MTHDSCLPPEISKASSDRNIVCMHGPNSCPNAGRLDWYHGVATVSYQLRQTGPSFRGLSGYAASNQSDSVNCLLSIPFPNGLRLPFRDPTLSHLPLLKMSPPLAPRHAWRSTGIQLRTESSQRPQWISNVRMILRQRNLSVSAVNHEENRQGPAVSRSEEDMSTPRPPSTTDNSDAAASDLGPAAAGKPKKPHSLKDIFPDLFRDSKPHVSQ